MGSRFKFMTESKFINHPWCLYAGSQFVLHGVNQMFLQCRKTILGSRLNFTCLDNIETACLRFLCLQNQAHAQDQVRKEDLTQLGVAAVKFTLASAGLE